MNQDEHAKLMNEHLRKQARGVTLNTKPAQDAGARAMNTLLFALVSKGGGGDDASADTDSQKTT